MCSARKVFLKISQDSQQDTCVRASFGIKLQVSGTSGGFFWICFDSLPPDFLILLKKSRQIKLIEKLFGKLVNMFFLATQIIWKTS